LEIDNAYQSLENHIELAKTHKTCYKRIMEHFDVILVLARIALDAEGSRSVQQRLRDLLKASDADQSAKLNRLLNRAGRKHTMAPLAMNEMRLTADAVRRQLSGEVLLPSTPYPTDRETGTPLARVIFPSAASEAAPILNESLAMAISDLLAEWKRTEDLAKVGAKPHMRCLLYGQPGVGKTKLARYLAAQMGLPCVEARLDGLMSSFLGTTARNIGALFDFANRYRCVLFLDEFDALAKARDDAQEIGEIKRVVNALLQSLDARNGVGITLAATNHEHLLDAAVWRRFDSRIAIPVPDQDARAILLTNFLKPLPVAAADLQLLVWATESMSGADIEMLVEAGKRFLVLRVEQTTEASANENRTFQRVGGGLILEALRRQAVLNVRIFHADRADLLMGPEDRLAKALDEAGFNQTDIGRLFGLSQSAVSRRKKRGEASEPRTEEMVHG
jgi:SpoVK/Ycf46/Vps4 family AAA+-type ATPase